MKLLSLSTLVLLVAFCSGAVFGQSEHAAELATQDVRPVNAVLTPDHWTNLLSADFKKPGKKDLFALVTLECGLFTGNTINSFADASVVVRVSVNGVATQPGVVSFCGKTNGLVPPFSDLSNCTSSSLGSCGLTASEIAEITRALHSHAFNFLFIRVPKGIQNITVQGSVNAGTSVGPVVGVIGKGSLEGLIVNLKEEASE